MCKVQHTPHPALTPFFTTPPPIPLPRPRGPRIKRLLCSAKIFFSIEVADSLTRRLCARSTTEETYRIL